MAFLPLNLFFSDVTVNPSGKGASGFVPAPVPSGASMSIPFSALGWSVLFMEGVNGFGISGMLPVSRPTLPRFGDGISPFCRELTALLLPFGGVTGTGERDDTSSSAEAKLVDGSPASTNTWLWVDDVTSPDGFLLSRMLPGALGSFWGEIAIEFVGEWRERNHRMTPRWTPRSPKMSEVSQEGRLTIGMNTNLREECRAFSTRTWRTCPL